MFPIAKTGLIDKRAVGTLVGLLQSERVQIVHTHNGRTHLNAALAVRRAGKGHCIATQHFIAPDHSTHRRAKAWLYGRAHGWVNRHTAGFIAVSQAVRQAMLDRLEAPAERITVVPNGIDMPELSGLQQRADVRSDLGIAFDAPLVACIARLEKEKDIASLIAAFRRIVTELPAAKCIVAGEGSLRAPLKKLIGDLALDESVHLLGFRGDAHALMLAADVVVLPSLAEPFGLVILEAMALGRPVAATRAGGPMEIVVDGMTGLLANPADPISLASVLLRLLGCPEEAARMGAAGLLRYQERYQSGHMAEATLQVYLRVTRASHGVSQ